MKKSLIVIIGIVLAAVGVVLWYLNSKATVDVSNSPTRSDEVVTGDFPVFDDTTSGIEQDLNSFAAEEELDSDINSMDADIQSF